MPRRLHRIWSKARHFDGAISIRRGYEIGGGRDEHRVAMPRQFDRFGAAAIESGRHRKSQNRLDFENDVRDESPSSAYILKITERRAVRGENK